MWQHCHAELHNLQTLRRHVTKLHTEKDANGTFRCRWRDCQSTNLGTAFNSSDAWTNHIEEQHLIVLARKFGDGPQVGNSANSRLDDHYLSDAAGQLVTPRATPMDDLSEDEEQQSQLLAPVLRRGMPRVRGKLSEEAREDELKLQQLEAKKFTIGPAMDIGGVRLATEERRRGFYDDEEFEGEVSADDGPELIA